MDSLQDNALHLFAGLKQRIVEQLAITLVLLFAAFATLAVLSIGARFASAASASQTSDQVLTVGLHEVTVLAGSSYESLVVDGGSFVLTLAEGDTARFRLDLSKRAGQYSGGGVSIDACEYFENGNYLTLSGPRVVTITPTDSSCSKASYGEASVLTLGAPQQSVFKEGDQTLVLWQTAGDTQEFSSVRIKLSVDGGLTYPTILEDHGINDGVYSWTVPLITTTTQARLRIEGLGLQDEVKVFDVSDAVFTINGIAPPPVVTEPETRVYDFDPAAVTVAAPSIGADRGIVAVTHPSGTQTCQPESRIKGASSAAVYYCGADGKRYVFPNQRIHDSWYQGFQGVVTLTDAQLAAIPIGGNATYRPGVRLVKITTDPKVYAVAAGGVLRWVPDEYTARDLYGDDWNTKVDDLPDAFFADYTMGETITRN